MATRLGRFEMPKQVTKDETASTENYGKFYAEPLRAVMEELWEIH